MERFEWNDDKNQWLKQVRGVCFEEVVYAIENDQLLDIVAHHNQDQYNHQRILYVAIEHYAYAVPFVEEPTYIFLKTIFPDQWATKKYLK